MPMFFSFISSIFFPEYCIDCGREGSVWCDTCLSAVTFWKQGVISTDMLDTVYIITNYDEPCISKALHELKYRGVKSVADQCGKLILQYFSFHSDFDGSSGEFWVVPIPISYKRYLARGYNQSALLAKHVQSAITNSSTKNILRRTKHSTSQVNLTKDERIVNHQNSFLCSVDEIPADVHVILVDDVITTGATLDACAGVLFAKGAKRVSAVVFAHGEQNNSLQAVDIIL